MNSPPQATTPPVTPPQELLEGDAKKERLGQWFATAICGNDITSSCLYVAAIATVYAHALAPLALLIVALILYLYRKIYTEVVEALPLNGGTYNCLLNSTRKFSAALAACLTILSYLATAVISGKTAAEYLASLVPVLPPMALTTAILIIFAALTIAGITESSRVALVIFIFHLSALSVLIISGLVFLVQHGGVWAQNWHALTLDVHWPTALFFGVSASMLGVSGFESSANFVEQQQPGVFRLTLRNMWVAVLIFNPLISLMALQILPVGAIVQHHDNLLSFVGFLTGGELLRAVVVVDAGLVLAGAVLTSYIGVTGLVHRMTLDQCFPQFLLKTNRRGSYHRIILAFMLLCISILYLTHGHLLQLAGVYTISFLGVMTLFGVGNILLKIHRKELKRTYRAGWTTVILGVLATSVGIVGNVIIDYRFLMYFAIYFIPAALLAGLMYSRITLLKTILNVINEMLQRAFIWREKVIEEIMDITNIRLVLFIRGGALSRLSKAFDYIQRNESSRNILVVHLYKEHNPEEEEEIRRSLKILEELHSDLKIEFITRHGYFGPKMVETLSQELKVPKNYMFIGAPEDKHHFSLEDLGGVRVIF